MGDSSQPFADVFQNRHCVKSVRIRSFSSPYFPLFGLNAGKCIPENSEYGHFSRNGCLADSRKEIIIFDNSHREKLSYDLFTEIDPSENKSLKVRIKHST